MIVGIINHEFVECQLAIVLIRQPIAYWLSARQKPHLTALKLTTTGMYDEDTLSFHD
jgi:hypothetical protein